MIVYTCISTVLYITWSMKDLHMYMYSVHVHSVFINPRRACAARVTVVVLSVCLSVCLSVTTFSAATSNKTANKRY